MKLALVQMFCGWGTVADNLRRSRTYIRQAAKEKADLVVFPETSVHGLWKDHMVRMAAEPLDGASVGRMRAWARQYQVGVAFGLAEKTAAKPYNAYLLVNRGGELVGVYRKNWVTPLESNYYRKDRRRPLFELEGHRLAVAICADCGDEALLRNYGRRGARLILAPHAWDADPILKDGQTAGWGDIEDMVDHFARGQVVGFRNHRQMQKRFVERLAPVAGRGGFFIAFVNQVGAPHPLIPFVGPSFVVGPKGQVLARSTNKREGILLVDVPL